MEGSEENGYLGLKLGTKAYLYESFAEDLVNLDEGEG